VAGNYYIGQHRFKMNESRGSNINTFLELSKEPVNHGFLWVGRFKGEFHMNHLALFDFLPNAYIWLITT
jgi:hypothetical protein